MNSFSSLSPDVAASVQSVIDAAARADGTAPVDEAVSLLLARGLGDARLYVDEGGFALVRPGDPHELDLVVHPDARGAGVGDALARAALTPAVSWAAWSHGDHPAARRLAERHGFRATRALWVMRLPAGAPLPSAPSEGPALRSFRPGEDDAEVLRVNAAAFASHPEQGRLDQAGLDERMAQSWFDPDGLVVADAGDRLAGFHWTKVHAASEDAPAHGEVYVIGVDPAAQGGGLGRRLLRAGLEHLRQRLGEDAEVELYVESDNAPAIAMYEKYGFGHADHDTHVQYRRGAVSLGP